METEESHNERKLEVRVAGNIDSDIDANDDDNVIYYDLTNKDWEIVKITKHGWNIETSMVSFLPPPPLHQLFSLRDTKTNYHKSTL